MGGLDEFESEALEQAQTDARGLTLGAYLKRLERHAEQLAAVCDENNGMRQRPVVAAHNDDMGPLSPLGAMDRR